jgi:hypothetical protein
MDNDLVTIELINRLEESVSQPSRARLSEPLAYFEFMQDSLLIAFNNGNIPLRLRNVKDDPKLFVFISTTRAFSIARIAMEITIRGYPMEGMALTRTLFELWQSTQYLARHSNLIDDYLLDKLKLDEVLKLAKKEDARPETSSFGRFWGLMSRYSHASPDLLTLSLITSAGNKVTANLVVDDPKRIEDTVFGIMGALFMQYFIFRIILKNDFSITDQLRERDRYIFQPANVRKYFRLSLMTDEELAQIYSLITSETQG